MLSEKETDELKRLRELQSDNERWLSQQEYDRITELAKKQYKIPPM